MVRLSPLPPRRRVARQPISTTLPWCAPILTQSPSVKGRSACSDSPANRLPSVSCSARPSTSERTAEEASSADRFTSSVACRMTITASRNRIPSTRSRRIFGVSIPVRRRWTTLHVAAAPRMTPNAKRTSPATKRSLSTRRIRSGVIARSATVPRKSAR
jgi:hypothetical protein